MTTISDRIFVSIGVSRPKGGLAVLPGALTASERMTVWARSRGYTTLLIHDGNGEEITIELLRDKITALIKEVTDRMELKRFVIYFAGHGVARDVNDPYWLLTNWRTRPTEAIRIVTFQRMLKYYGPRQVTVIGDACQEYSSSFIDLVGSPVLDALDEEPRRFELDQFFAVEVTEKAFMIKSSSGNLDGDFCLFTEVLLNGLEGDGGIPYCDVVGTDQVITSQSLARYLEDKVPTEAGKHGLRMEPDPRPGFYTDRVYQIMGQPPPPESSSFESADIAEEELGDALSETDDSISFETATFSTCTRAVTPAISLESADLPPMAVTATDDSSPDLMGERIATRERFIEDVGSQTVRDHFETDCGICISGSEVSEIKVSGSADVSRAHGDQEWYRVAIPQPAEDGLLGWSDALITLADGNILSVCAVHTFIAALHISEGKPVSLFHQHPGTNHSETDLIIEFLADANAGLLNPSTIIDVAAATREKKHRFITLGCIIAQFYDMIQDLDSLHSMAAFYAMNRQPIPLDIVLLSEAKLYDRDDQLYADIPAVEQREPRTENERLLPFTYESTPKISKHPVAGRVPWLKQAWSGVGTANCDSSAAQWRTQAIKAMEHLGPGLSTIIKPEGRNEIFKLANIPPEERERPRTAMMAG